jgi:hypothetical protein
VAYHHPPNCRKLQCTVSPVRCAFRHAGYDQHQVRLAQLRLSIEAMLTSSPRTSLCHLLSLITRRKHVKPFRIQQMYVDSRNARVRSRAQAHTDMISVSSYPAVLVTSLHFKDFSAFSRITTPISSLEVHPQVGSRLLR